MVDKKTQLMLDRVKACTLAMDRGNSTWSRNFWLKTINEVIANCKIETERK
tara:strand:- start:2135 stop:2287 length:153 start_codon:yes stop_codon:yes gene_type:complete